MRTTVCQILILSVLYMGADAAWDMALESHAHQEAAAHQLEDEPGTNSPPDPTGEPRNDHCGHLCLGHTCAIAMSEPQFAADYGQTHRILDDVPRSIASPAPPTPPPNA